MLEFTPYRELTAAVLAELTEEHRKGIDVFTVAAMVKPHKEAVIEETAEIGWEEWDCKSPLGLQEPEDIKANLCPEQTIFVIKKGDVMIASYSKSPLTGEKITAENIKTEAERFVTAYRAEYMKQRLMNIVFNELVDKK